MIVLEETMNLYGLIILVRNIVITFIIIAIGAKLIQYKHRREIKNNAIDT